VAAWAEILATLHIDSSKAKGEVEKGLKSADATGAGKQVGERFNQGVTTASTAPVKGHVEGALKSADGEGAGKAVGQQYVSGLTSVSASGVKGSTEKALASPDAAGAGKTVGGKYTGAIAETSTVPIKGATEKALVAANAEGAGRTVGRRFTDAIREPLGAITGMLGGALAIGGGVELFKGIMDQGGAALKATKVVADAIKVTGGAAGVTAGQIDTLAAAQSRSTGVDKAAVQQSDALLLRYTNVRNAAGANNDVFNRTTQAALDLTAAQNKGVVSADALANTTKILGKAMDDPAKASGVLRRYGVDLTAQQQEQIKTFTASGHTLEAQKVILDAIGKSYGGTAAATASGTAKMKAGLSELEATIGKVLVPLFGQLVKGVTAFLDVLAPITDWFARGGTAAKILTDAIVALLAIIAAYVITAKVAAAIDTVTAATRKALTIATKAYAAAGEEASVMTRLWAAAQALLNGVMDANVLFLIVLAIGALIFGLVEAYKHSAAFRAIVQSAWGAVKAVAVPAAHALAEAVSLVGQVIRAVASVIGSAVSGPIGLVVGAFHSARDALTGFIGDWTTSSNIFTGTFAATWNYIAHYAADIGRIVFAPIRAAQAAFSSWWAGSGDQVKEVWHDLWAGLSAVFRVYWDVITAEVRLGWLVIRALFEAGAAIVTAAWRVTWLLLGPVFKVAWDVVLAELRIGWAVIRAEFQIGMALVTAVWRVGWALLTAVFRTQWALITAVAKVLWDIFAGVITVGLDVLTGRWGKAWRDVLNVLRQVWNAMTAFLRSTLGAWTGFFSTAISAIVSVWRAGWNALSSVAKAVVGAITGVIRGLINVVKEIPAAFQAAVGGVTSALNSMKNAVVGPVDFITSKLGSIGKVFNSISGAVGLASKIPGLAAGGLVSAIPGLAEGGRVTAGTGPTADDVLVRVSRDETVVSAEHSGILAPWFRIVGVPGYAKGGVIGKAASAAASTVQKGVSAAVNSSESAISAVKSATGSAATELASQVVTVAGKALDMGKITMAMFTGDKATIHGAFEHLLGEHHPGPAPDSLMDKLVIKTPEKIVDDITDWLHDNGGAANGSAILTEAMTYANKVPYVWGGAQPTGWDCSGFVSWIYQKHGLLHQRMVADALQSWGKGTPGPVPGGMVFFGKPAHHVGFAMDTSKYLSALGHKWGTIVSSVAGNSGFAIPPVGFDQVNGAGAGGMAAPGTFMNPGGGVAGWAATVSAALGLAHFSLSLVPQVLHQISTESGGNPRAINNWDSNAKAGIPSKGLLQVIDPTFNAYAGPLRGRGIWDPLANIYAAIMYAAARYGPSLMRGSMGLGSGHGYAAGGPINEPITGIGLTSGTLYTFGEQGREWVIPEHPPAGTRGFANGGLIGTGPAAYPESPALLAAIDRLTAALDDVPGQVAQGVAQALDGVARNSAVGAQWSTR
jgi:SLT domain-containing protein/cell wall-associated NlpC family hydrolase